MKNTRAIGWGMWAGLASTLALGGCDLVAGIGEFCEIGVDPGCGTGGAGPGGGGTGGTTSPSGGGGSGGAPACSPMGSEQPCYSGPDGSKDVGICVGGKQVCQPEGTWGTCDGEVVPGIETCASTDDEDCDAKECALWSKILGDSDEQVPLDVAFDKQGNVVLLGYFTGKISLGNDEIQSAGMSDLFLAKFDSEGQPIWVRRFGDSGDQERASLAIDSNDNIILAGAFVGTIDFGGKTVTAVAGGMDAFVAKLTPNGVPAWANRYGDGADQEVSDVALDSSNDVLVIGEFAGNMLLKNNIMAANGTDVWVGRFDGSTGSAIGEIHFDDKAGQSGALNIGTGPAGTWAISGLHGNGAVIGGSTLTGIGSFVAKYSPNDVPIWSVSLPVSTPTGTLVDSAGAVVMVADFFNTVNVGGVTLTSKGIADIALLKLASSDGTVQWANAYGGDGNDQAARLAADANGDIFFALAEDSSTINLGGMELTGKGLEDLFVVALNSDGTHRWSRGVGDATSQGLPRIASEASGKGLAVALRTDGTINFGAGDLNSNGNDVAIAKLAP